MALLTLNNDNAVTTDVDGKSSGKGSTSRSVTEAVHFIAKHNKNKRCMLVDDNIEGIWTDFDNFEINPTEELWCTTSTDPATGTERIIGLVGLLDDRADDVPTAIVMGPWADNEADLPILLDLVIAKAHVLGFKKLTSGMVGEVANNVFQQAGFKNDRNDLSMIMKAVDLTTTPPVATANDSVTCALLRPYPLDQNVHEDVLAIHKSLFRSKDYSSENWKDKFGESATNWAFAATLDGKTVGYAIVQQQNDHLYLVNIGTDTSHQKRKVASTLLLHLRQWFAQSSFSHMHLNVNVVNAHAAKLYENVGFKVETFAYSWDKIIS